MALTSSSNPPIPPHATPTVDTGRTAAVRAAIRADIRPEAGWWQFEFQPWHYWTAITSAVIIAVGFTVLVVIERTR